MASCLRGALPPVDLRAVCFVLAMMLIAWTMRRNDTNIVGLVCGISLTLTLALVSGLIWSKFVEFRDNTLNALG